MVKLARRVKGARPNGDKFCKSIFARSAAPPTRLFKRRDSEINDRRRRKNGMPKSEKRLKELIDSYFEVYLEQSGEIADIESLADYLGTTRDGFLSLIHDEKYGYLLKSARNRIAKIKKQLAFCGKIPAAVLSFDLKNNHGYRDKPDESELQANEPIIFNGKAADWAQ